MTINVATDTLSHLDKNRYTQQINVNIDHILKRLDRTLVSYVAFNMAFVGIGCVEFLLLMSFFTFLAQSSVLALSLAVLFLTLFSYFILRLYFNTRKPEQLLDLRDDYLNSCKQVFHYQEGIPKHHMTLASAACKLAAALHDREYHYYSPPAWLDILGSTMETFSCWWHWYDLHTFKELLLLCSVDEHIKLVKCEPTNLQAHAALANAYVMLSSIYSNPQKAATYDSEHFIAPQRFSEAMQQQFRAAAERAIEEFKILNDYAPNDPWVHAQLAYSYHDLQMPQEEIKEYETILRINPADKETFFKLGMLYFQQGHNAKGLRIYEELKHSHYNKAENLIKFYGAYNAKK